MNGDVPQATLLRGVTTRSWAALGGDSHDDLDGGGASGTKEAFRFDHWNRRYGDAGSDVCHQGPWPGQTQLTNYRDASCELVDTGVAGPGGG